MRLLLLVCLGVSFSAMAQPDVVRKHVQNQQQVLLTEYMQFLAIPNVMGDSVNIQRNAAFIQQMMEARGIQTRQFNLPIKGSSPLVYGEVKVPGATTTIGFYAHYDGQPVNPAQWAKGLSPFVPQLTTDRLDRGGVFVQDNKLPAVIPEKMRIYARGSSDDKAGVFAILAAYDALIKTGNAPKANLKFIFEGEEEAGSINLHAYFKQQTALLKTDLWIICDGPNHASGSKQLIFGVRGDANAELKVYGSARPLHSGNYGNWAPNAAMRMAQLLASMKNDKGMVTIPGFYDDALPLTKTELAAIKNIPDVVPTLRDELGMINPDGDGRSFQELLNIPTLNINGFAAMNVGAMASNIIPAVATAALDLRLVKGNTVDGQFNKLKRFIENKGYKVLDHEPTMEERKKYPLIASLTLKEGSYPAQKTPMNLPMAQKVISAIQTTTSSPVLKIPTLGGSLPLFIFDTILQSPPVSIGIVNFDNNQHAENENLQISFLLEGIVTMASVMGIR
ncbi:MAG TPA: M20/M25/M40 family metallo-hydrolase [Phnomibacter sp.]|nr:M20/M25/M40 family metallo-hydrolase [Phnomibacter sp.]